MKKRVYLILIMLCHFSACLAAGTLTSIQHTKLYSEYYPNPDASFQGTILFENGSGVPLTEWTKTPKFFDCIKKLGNVFFYDRSGVGKSPDDPALTDQTPLTPERVSSMLIPLIAKRGIKPPFILVAHSYGGMYAGYFARTFPFWVKGILLVDPVPPDFEWRFAFLERFKTGKDRKKRRPELHHQLRGFERSKAQLKALAPLSDDIPIIVLSSSEMEKVVPVRGDWYTLQKQWLNNHPKSKIMKLDSSHYIQKDHPDFVCEQLKILTSP